MRVHNGDCMRWLEAMESGTVDCILTDPPYCHGNASASQRSKNTTAKYHQTGTHAVKPEFFGDCRDQRSMEKWFAMWLSECWRVAKDGAFCMVFINDEHLASVIDAVQIAGFAFQGVFSWCKPAARPRKGMFSRNCEYVVVASKGAIVHREKYAKGYMETMFPNPKARIHTTEKPVKLLEHLLTFVPDGGKVIDPFAGSGSTGEACFSLGLDFEGCELSQEYAKLANDRLEALCYNAAQNQEV